MAFFTLHTLRVISVSSSRPDVDYLADQLFS